MLSGQQGGQGTADGDGWDCGADACLQAVARLHLSPVRGRQLGVLRVDKALEATSGRVALTTVQAIPGTECRALSYLHEA